MLEEIKVLVIFLSVDQWMILLIPVTFLAELSTCATLWYVSFTDIFSAIRFIVKGIECIITADRNTEVITVFRSGNSTAGQLEIWTAFCSGTAQLLGIGIAFVGLGLFRIILATLLHFIQAFL